MKVSELTAAQIDYWVARAEGIEHPRALRKMAPGFVMVPYESEDSEGPVTRYRAFQPSSSWADGGPLVGRGRITIAWQPMKGEWMAGLIGSENGSMLEFNWRGFDGSPLIAAMRAVVANYYGNEVPDEAAE